MEKIIKALCYVENERSIIPNCPICGCTHIHGVTESKIIDGQETFGYRVPHCVNIENKPASYLLVIVNKNDCIYQAREENEAIGKNFRESLELPDKPNQLTIF